MVDTINNVVNSLEKRLPPIPKKSYATITFRSFRTLLPTIVVLTSYVIAQIGECMVPEALRRMGWVLPPHQPWQSGADIYAVKGNEILVGQINDFAMKSFIKPDRWMRYLDEFDAHPEATIKAMFISFKNNLTKDQVRDCLERNIIIVIIGFQILSMDEGVLQLVISSIAKGIMLHVVRVGMAKKYVVEETVRRLQWADTFGFMWYAMKYLNIEGTFHLDHANERLNELARDLAMVSLPWSNMVGVFETSFNKSLSLPKCVYDG